MWNHSIECYADLRNNVREQELFKSVVIGNTMKNRIKRNTKRIKRSHAEENWMQRELHSQNQEGSGSTKMSKGSKRRPKLVSDKQFQEAWDNIFVRKVTPKHGQSKVHRDKSKYNRNESKRELQKDDFQ
jgi:hypothetical protein